MKEILLVNNVSHLYDGYPALDQLSFSLCEGERLAVLGPTGSGKTTLLRLIAGLEAPSMGEIAIQGHPASRTGEILIAPQYREVAMVFQGLALFPHLNALQQIAFAVRGRGSIEHARKLLAAIGLAHRASARLDELSGGERQRIALARALAQEPKLLLMDEPFASLDDVKRAEMRELLRSLLDRFETTLILVTHSRDDAFDLAKRVLVLDQGRSRAFGALEDLLTSPRHSSTAKALGLGEVLQGEIVELGEAQTAFGKVAVSKKFGPGQVQVLVRPGQVSIVSGQEGVEVEVASVELRSSDLREVRRIAVVRVGSVMLRLVLREHKLRVGARVRIRIDGEGDVVEDRIL